MVDAGIGTLRQLIDMYEDVAAVLTAGAIVLVFVALVIVGLFDGAFKERGDYP